MADLIQELFDAARRDFFAHGPFYNGGSDENVQIDAYTPDICAWGIVEVTINNDVKAQAYMSTLIGSGPPPSGLTDALEFGIGDVNSWPNWVQPFVRRRITDMLQADDEVMAESRRRQMLPLPTSLP